MRFYKWEVVSPCPVTAVVITLKHLMFELHNDTIEQLGLSTPSGCMGEAREYEVRIRRSGALEYHGKQNVERLGRHKGAANLYCFDSIAHVISTSGFLQLPLTDESSHSTVGVYQLTVIEPDKQFVCVRDALNMPPIFWAVVHLIEMMVDRADWGDDAYDDAISTFPSRVDGSYYEISPDSDVARRDGYF